MTINGWIQIALFCVVVTLLVRPLGGYMTRIFNGERTLLSPVLRPVERGLYAVCGVDEREEQHWVTYGIAMLAFTLAGFVVLYALQRLQAILPFNPAGQAAVSPDLAFNTSVSFVTNTNWQSYTPESTMSYLTQMAGPDGAQLPLGRHRHRAGDRADPWLLPTFRPHHRQLLGRYDTVRALRAAAGLDRRRAVLRLAGHAAEPGAYTEATTLEGAKQVIAQGPVASQEVIKMFGTNGGGFFNANSAHPFENPNALTNLIQMVLIFAIGAAH